MPDTGFTNLFIVASVALLAPLAAGLLPRLRIPAVVLEILAGVALGPAVLGVVEADLPVEVLAVVGLAFLLFMVGLELDVTRLRGPVLRGAVAGYLLTLLLGTTVGVGAAAAGWVASPLLVAVALSATSLGLVVPVLQDAGRTDSALGRATVAAATLADVVAVLLLTLLFSAAGGSVGARLILLVSFGGVVVVVGTAVALTERWRRLGELLTRLQDTTAEIRVRAAVLLLVAFVALAEQFGLETILGALLAGAVIGAVDRDDTGHPLLRTKLEAIGYGFVVPVFFVASGIRLDVAGLLADPAALARTPLFLLALLVVRGLPALLLRHGLTGREVAAAGLLQATSLPFLVTATMIGVEAGLMTAVTAAALVAAGVLSVLLFPAAALTLLAGASPPARRITAVRAR
ncbi:MAG: cation:proton antiporter [Nocardioidaceae bacterium]